MALTLAEILQKITGKQHLSETFLCTLLHVNQWDFKPEHMTRSKTASKFSTSTLLEK